MFEQSVRIQFRGYVGSSFFFGSCYIYITYFSNGLMEVQFWYHRIEPVRHSIVFHIWFCAAPYCIIPYVTRTLDHDGADTWLHYCGCRSE